MTIKYGVFIKDPTTGYIIELVPKSYSFTDEINKESTAKFVLAFEDIQKIAVAYGTTVMAVFTSAFREIWIERNGVKIFWGAVSNFQVSPDGQGGKTINIDGLSWFGLFNKRKCGIPKRIFTGVDAGTIAWTLIDENQASDGSYSNLGITQGAHPTTKNRDRTYSFDNIKDSIIRLSNNNLADGFDFDIDNTKQFNVYYPTKGTDLPDVVFDERTLANWLYKKSLIGSLTNKVYALGAGQNDDIIYVTRTSGTTPRTNWFTQEEVIKEQDVIETATLNDKGDALLDLNEEPTPNFAPEHYDKEDLIQWTDYSIGDTVRLDMPDLGYNLASVRVIKRDFTMDTSKSIGYIKVTLQ